MHRVNSADDTGSTICGTRNNLFFGQRYMATTFDMHEIMYDSMNIIHVFVCCYYYYIQQQTILITTKFCVMQLESDDKRGQLMQFCALFV